MAVSLFLAKLLGLYMLIVALIALLRKDQFKSVMRSIISSEGLIAILGILSLISGLAILIGHPIWEFSWRGLITLIGALAVIQGIWRFAFASLIQEKFTMDKFEKARWIMIIVLGIIGIFLTYMGFMNHP